MTAVDQPADVLTDPGWFPDPRALHHLRYFDGSEWTDHVTHRGPEPCSGCHEESEVSAFVPSPTALQPIDADVRPINHDDLANLERRRAPDRRRRRGREDPSPR